MHLAHFNEYLCHILMNIYRCYTETIVLRFDVFLRNPLRTRAGYVCVTIINIVLTLLRNTGPGGAVVKPLAIRQYRLTP